MVRKSLPTITESSATSRLAVRQFLVALPGTWTTSEPKEGDDYGIDVTTHIADGNHPSGRQCHVQIKGTRADGSTANVFRIKETTLNHLRSMADVAVLLRTQVELQRSWMIHIHDGRTMREADDEGWLRIVCDDGDLVDTLSLRRRISALSYRKWWQTSHQGEYRIWVDSPDKAVVLHSMFDGRLPDSLRFYCGDPDDVAVQGEAEVTPTNLVLRDRATKLVRDQHITAPAVVLVSLAAFFGQTGAWSLAIGILASSADLIDDAALETLTRAEEYHLLGVLIDHATEEQLLRLSDLGLRRASPWAARWFANFLLNRPMHGVTNTMIDRCFVAWPNFETNTTVKLLKANLLARYQCVDECKTLLNQMPPSAVSDPAALFELGLLSASVKLFAKARYAWSEARRAGYDPLSCRLETARSFLAEGDLTATLKAAPKKGQAKDQRNEALLDIFRLLRRVFQERKAIHKLLRDLGTLNHTLELLLAKHATEPNAGSALLICAVAIVRALRDEEDVEAWSLALEHGIRASIPPPLIDAIIRLAGGAVGGEPLRRAAVGLDNPHQKAVLERWHRRIDQLQQANLVRRREDFVRSSKA